MISPPRLYLLMLARSSWVYSARMSAQNTTVFPMRPVVFCERLTLSCMCFPPLHHVLGALALLPVDSPTAASEREENENGPANVDDAAYKGDDPKCDDA